MLAFHVGKSKRGHWYFVADNTGLQWTRDLRTSAEARAALAVLRNVAHRS